MAGLRLITAYGRGKSGGLGWMVVETHVADGDEVWPDTMLLVALKEAHKGQST